MIAMRQGRVLRNFVLYYIVEDFLLIVDSSWDILMLRGVNISNHTKLMANEWSQVIKMDRRFFPLKDFSLTAAIHQARILWESVSSGCAIIIEKQKDEILFCDSLGRDKGEYSFDIILSAWLWESLANKW